jgi:hypothetical protein
MQENYGKGASTDETQNRVLENKKIPDGVFEIFR